MAGSSEMEFFQPKCSLVCGAAFCVPMLGEAPLLHEPRTAYSEKGIRSILTQAPKVGKQVVKEQGATVGPLSINEGQRPVAQEKPN